MPVILVAWEERTEMKQEDEKKLPLTARREPAPPLGAASHGPTAPVTSPAAAALVSWVFLHQATPRGLASQENSKHTWQAIEGI